MRNYSMKWSEHIGEFVVEMGKTWGARLTGGFLIALLSAWYLTGHSIPPRIGWAIIMGGVVVAAFQVWKRQVTTNERLEQELKSERFNHAAEITGLTQALNDKRAINNPFLVFNVETEMRGGTFCDIHITIENAGQLPTKIACGEARLKSFRFPTADEVYSLVGIELVGKGKRTIVMTVKHGLLIDDTDPTIQAAHLTCDAISTQPEGTFHQLAKFVYVPNKRRFEREI
jgi:hypothetical protein